MFMNGGEEAYGGGKFWGYDVKVDTPNLDKHVQVHICKTLHWTKMTMRVLVVLLVVYMIFMLFCKWVPESIKAWDGVYNKSSFTQKENLQWLGASTDVVRGDYENNQDSLAERSMKTDARVTDITQPMAAPATKLTFTSRERYMSPEEELMKKQQM